MTNNKMGHMTIGDLGNFVRGYIMKSMEIFDMGTQQYGYFANKFPTDDNLPTPRLVYNWQSGVAGRKDVTLDAPVEDSRWSNKSTSVDLNWDKFSFTITDSVTDAAIAKDQLATGMRNAMRYFAAIRDFKVITELRAKHNVHCTHSADTYWTDPAAQVEEDIITAIQGIVKYSKGIVNPEAVTFGILYPVDCMMGFDSLGSIGNIQTTVKEYLKKTWNINMYPYSPAAFGSDGDEIIDVLKNTDSDALGNNALVFVEGQDTMKCGNYRGSGIKMAETTRIHDVGYKTTLRNCFGCLAKPLYDDNTYTTPLIYKVTSVTA